MKKSIFGLAVILLCCSFYVADTLNGKWDYAGGIYNGKAQGATKDYKLQRQYSDTGYQSFVISNDQPPERYEAGNYTLQNDTCFETQTFSIQPSRLTGKTLKYLYTLRNDTLIFKGTLPSGMTVIEYWKKVR